MDANVEILFFIYKQINKKYTLQICAIPSNTRNRLFYLHLRIITQKK